MRAKLELIAERLLDKLWDLTLPLSGTCPVCAFYRGLLCGVILSQVSYVVWKLA